MQNLFTNQKGSAAMSPVGIAIVIISLIGLFIGAYIIVYGISGFLKHSSLLMSLSTVALAVATVCMVYYSAKSNQMAEKIFVGQDQPMVDVAPIAIMQNSFNDQVTTFFSISNYSGFTAYDVRIDLNYGKGGAWILEWNKANRDNEAKGDVKGIQKNRPYLTLPGKQGKTLPPGETYTPDELTAPYGITGQLDLDDACGEKRNILVRVSWRNKQNHIFDKVHQYRLVCTKVKEGLAFTFMPKGIISNKQD